MHVIGTYSEGDPCVQWSPLVSEDANDLISLGELVHVQFNHLERGREEEGRREGGREGGREMDEGRKREGVVPQYGALYLEQSLMHTTAHLIRVSKRYFNGRCTWNVTVSHLPSSF